MSNAGLLCVPNNYRLLPLRTHTFKVDWLLLLVVVRLTQTIASHSLSLSLVLCLQSSLWEADTESEGRDDDDIRQNHSGSDGGVTHTTLSPRLNSNSVGMMTLSVCVCVVPNVQLVLVEGDRDTSVVMMTVQFSLAYSCSCASTLNFFYLIAL